MSQDSRDTSPGADAAAPENKDSPAPSPSSMHGVKVELDIDDAPFLDEPEEEKAPEPEPEKPPQAPPKEPPGEKKPGKLAALLANKKLLAVAGGGAAAVILIPLLLLLFLGGEKEPPPPPPPEPIRTPAPAPVREDAPQGPKYVYAFEPFFLERRGAEGEIRFLRCRFSVPTDNPALYAELQGKTIAVRDSVYYYLAHKPLTFLSDSAISLALKEDLISVINENLATEKIQELFIEEYLISGR